MASLLVTVLASIAIPCVLTGIVCNAVVIFCILCTPCLRTRTNAIIISLAFSSFCFLFFVVPFIIDSFLTNTWRYSMWYCHLTARLSFILVGVTVDNIAVLGLYRYFCVVQRSKPALRGKWCIIILISLCWVVPMLLQFVVTFTGWTKSLFIPSYGRCILAKNSVTSGRAYDVLVLTGIITPLLIALFSYGSIIIAVKSSARKVRAKPKASQRESNTDQNEDVTYAEGASTCPDPTILYTDGKSESQVTEPSCSKTAATTSQVARNGRRRRGVKKRGVISHQEIVLTKICAVMFVLFSACYGPIFLLTIAFTSTAFPPDAYTTCTVIYWMGSCINPIVYATLQTEMRSALMKIIPRLTCKGQRQGHSVNM
ncbi:G-protein coupled receptor moody-like [Lytechinus variegatus]|uniref:G-protein coupled receptor moody-like n=1 Tax=Lytechinus variegatus TaxID=7654 RepID=UPI001BB120AE|nr:G-protein coupled receptor moody-like [Lytechinus variegatus]